MLTFYRTRDCPRCAEIQETLREMNYAHEVVEVKNSDELEEVTLKGRKLPLLKDDRKVIEGSHAIIRHLEELGEFKELWDKFQGDYCYCDDEGGIE